MPQYTLFWLFSRGSMSSIWFVQFIVVLYSKPPIAQPQTAGNFKYASHDKLQTDAVVHELQSSCIRSNLQANAVFSLPNTQT